MITLKIITPMESATIADVTSVSLPGAAGPFVVLKGHAPLVSILSKGILAYIAGGKRQERQVERGAVKVEGDTVTVCIDR